MICFRGPGRVMIFFAGQAGRRRVMIFFAGAPNILTRLIHFSPQIKNSNTPMRKILTRPEPCWAHTSSGARGPGEHAGSTTESCGKQRRGPVLSIRAVKKTRLHVPRVGTNSESCAESQVESSNCNRVGEPALETITESEAEAESESRTLEVTNGNSSGTASASDP